MRKTLCAWLSLLSLVGVAQAQNANLACGNGRYVSNLFPDPPTKTADVIFGYNTSRNYASGVNTPVTLKLDVYEPTGDVTATQRPLIILAFGGAFVQGSRQDADIVAICQEFARKGYVTAAIDYRLIENDPNNQTAIFLNQSYLTDEVIRAVSDLKAAVRFFKHDAASINNNYRIDPTKIFVGGFSAGAITALEAAYTDAITDNPTTQAAYVANGGLEGNTDFPAPNNLLSAYDATGIAGVFNIAGGVNSLSIVDANDPPLYSAQGTADQTVPYDCGTIQGTRFTICGSNQLQQRSTAVGLANQLHPVVGGGHSSPAIDPDRTQIIAEAAAFLQPLVCGAGPLPVVLTSFSGRVGDDCTVTLTWQTASERNSRAYEVQASGNGKTFAPLGTVPSENRAAGAAYTYRAGPVLGTRYYRLRLVDADGTAAYSPVVALRATCEVEPLQLVPNPVRDYALVSGLPTGLCQLLLYSATGQRVLSMRAEGSARLVLSGLSPGVYLLKVLAPDGTPSSTTRVVKE